MLYLSSALFFINLLMKDIRYLLVLSILVLLIIKVKKIHNKISKFVYIFYLFLSLSQIFLLQEGEVLVKIYGFYITKEAVIVAVRNFIKIINLVFLSKIFGSKIKIGKVKFVYAEIIEEIITFVPDVFIMFRNRVGIKDVYKRILTKVYRNL